MHKTIYSAYDHELLNELIRHNNLHQHLTRNSSNLVLPLYNRSSSQNSVNYTGVRIWNSLPNDISNEPNLNIFKRKLRNMLLSSYSPI